MSEWNIKTIEAMTEAQAQEMAEAVMTVKGHKVYFIDFDGYFKFSRCVFYEGAHIYYANDYELHHNGRSREELMEMYISGIQNKVFDDSEMDAVNGYDDYNAKEYYLRNYYPQRKEHVSIFRINPSAEEQRDFKEKTKDMFYNPIGFAFFYDKKFVDRNIELYAHLSAAYDKSAKSYEFMKSAFLSEMYNHEYGINWQADFDTLSAFGNIVYHRGDYTTELEDYFTQLGYGDIEKKAYIDARREYYRKSGYEGY